MTKKLEATLSKVKTHTLKYYKKGGLSLTYIRRPLST